MGFSSFLHFSLYLEAAAALATITLHALAMWADSGLHPASSQRKEKSGYFRLPYNHF
jgi:hypothetical protein